jgi:hypothetical protein
MRRLAELLRRRCAGLAGAVFLAWVAPAAPGADTLPAARPRALPGEIALAKARTRYRMLLRQIKVPADAETYGDFHDLGPRDQREYAGFKDLPKGHWVYVYPCWYIWQDVVAVPRDKRGWGPEQATGPPDTPGAGDLVTAWASLTPDGQDEWLMLEYDRPAVPAAVLVHETYNPGAVRRVTVFRLDGEEVEAWKGADPTPVGAARGVSEILVRVPFKTNRVKIYLDSKGVPGWNEIDAVGLRDTADQVQWASAAAASSTFADAGAGQGFIMVFPGPIPAAPVPAPPAPLPAPKPIPLPMPAPAPPPAMPAQPDPRDKRIQRLEDEVRQLRKEVKELRELIRKK